MGPNLQNLHCRLFNLNTAVQENVILFKLSIAFSFFAITDVKIL